MHGNARGRGREAAGSAGRGRARGARRGGSAMMRRVDPRRPAFITTQGLRRIVLGGTEGERNLRQSAGAHATVRRPRLTQPVSGCLLVLTHPDSGGIDEHARETIAAAALLARADEAVVVM